MSTEKNIIFTNKIHPLLENFELLDAPLPERYEGYIYMWKCIPEDCYYIGKHVGFINSGYDGTGKRFKAALRYYGITQFKRIIIEYVHDISTITKREQFWIDKFNAIKSKNFYNIRNSIKE